MPEITSYQLWDRYCPEAEPEEIVELGQEAITQQLIELRYDAHQMKGEGDAVAMTCAEIARVLICYAEAWVEGREVLSRKLKHRGAPAPRPEADERRRSRLSGRKFEMKGECDGRTRSSKVAQGQD